MAALDSPAQGQFRIPSGTAANLPATAAAGQFYYETDTGLLEFYTGTAWVDFTQFAQTLTQAAGINALTLSSPQSGSSSTSPTLAFRSWNGTSSVGPKGIYMDTSGVLNFAFGQLNVPIIVSNGIIYGEPNTLSSTTVASGTVYQPSPSRYVFLYIPITYNPTSTAAATVAVALGTSAAPSTIYTTNEPAGLTTGRVEPIVLRVPPNFYFSLTATNATIGTATQTLE